MRPMRAVLLSTVTALLLFAPAHSQTRDVKLETQRASHLIRDRRYEEAIAVLEPVCRKLRASDRPANARCFCTSAR